MKSVLIVGAGPAGLVAAKTLLQRPGTPFRVTIFESAERVGGMWATAKGQEGVKCDPTMRTNLSRFTVGFSDFSWRSFKTQDDSTTPMFPKAYQVGQYLEEYTRRFVFGATIALNREVTSAKLEGQPRTWRVSSFDKGERTTHEDSFDYLIVASGFFAEPDLRSFDKSSSSTQIQHSSKFRSAQSLTNGRPGNIVVVGGGMSGSEAAATAALELSNAKYATGEQKRGWAESKVYHVFDRPFYCVPRYIPRNPYNAARQDYRLAPDFLPLDLVFYDLSRRGRGIINASNGIVPPEKALKGHEFLRSVIGGDQRELGHTELVYNHGQTGYPAYTGISDTYAEFVRSGIIVPWSGRVDTIAEDNEQARVQLLAYSAWSTTLPTLDVGRDVENVVGIVAATGFKVNLDYLDPAVRQALGHDPSCQRVPLCLTRGSIFEPKVPEIAFVGFYEGPYWGVMELQAQLIAQQWSGDAASDSPIFTDTTESQAIRTALKAGDFAHVPQFWMPDYIGMMEEFSRTAHIQRDDSLFPAQTGPVFPARYPTTDSQQSDSQDVIREVHSLVDDSNPSTRFVAAATFRAMQGSWTLRRKIDSRNDTYVGGTFKGTAHFHPRYPTAPTFSAEYLYIEEGTFTIDDWGAFPATRRYVYRYNENTDKISTWFVQEDGVSAERLFNELVFRKPVKADGSEDPEKGWLAFSEHWCSPDTYKSSCEFRFRGASLPTFGITYVVEGPKKDYTHESWYERLPPGGR
ncbi:hypothetical protein M011DRAFT_493076 [Sporormia fimetaria CBS 119925]|uniref:Uncharacterized protein n=1 Tax=Sporormia fimetaria CBS 119925 TaxID=1340428 RepID=A0A6A6VFF2_9PLEO|nr:hypothetical protein M011DRAFT_493076 [Sporormia fimetaria CBS 119925]